MGCEQNNIYIKKIAILSNTAYIKDFSVFAPVSEANVPWEGVGGEVWLPSSCSSRQWAFLGLHPPSIPSSIWTWTLLPESCQCSPFAVIELDISETFNRNWNRSVVFRVMIFWHGFTDSSRSCLFPRAPFGPHARHSLYCQASFQLLRVQTELYSFSFWCSQGMKHEIPKVFEIILSLYWKAL